MGPSIYERIYGNRKVIGAALAVAVLVGTGIHFWPSPPDPHAPEDGSQLPPALARTGQPGPFDATSGPAPEAAAGPDSELTTLDATAYLVVPGNSLWCIAHRKCGSGVSWRALYAANHTLIDDPDLIFPGQVLVIRCEASP